MSDFADRGVSLEVGRLGRFIASDQINRLAPIPLEQRTDRSDQQLGEVGQARRVLASELRPLPDPFTALRQQAQLGTPRHHRSTMKSEVPIILHLLSI